MLTSHGEADAERGFRDYLAESGIRAEILAREVGPDPAHVAPVLAGLSTLGADLVYTRGAAMTLAVAGPYDAPDPSAFVRDRPVVFAMVAAPVQARIVADLARPGGNVTGAMHVVPVPVQLRAMESYRPFAKVGILYSPAEPGAVAILEEVRSHCAAAGKQVIARTFAAGAGGAPTADGIAGLVAELKAAGADWLYLVPDSFVASVLDQLAPAAVAAGLPTFAATESAMRQGGVLVGLVSRGYAVGQLAGAKAMDILVARTPVHDVPVDTLKRFALMINVDMAKKLGVYPPIGMLNYAEVITS